MKVDVYVVSAFCKNKSGGNLAERVNEFGGISQNLMRNKELLQTVLPSLRADEKFAETYKEMKPIMVNCPIDVWGGKQDSIAHDKLLKWLELTSNPGEFYLFDGGHFFAQDCEEEVIGRLLERIVLSFE